MASPAVRIEPAASRLRIIRVFSTASLRLSYPAGNSASPSVEPRIAGEPWQERIGPVVVGDQQVPQVIGIGVEHELDGCRMDQPVVACQFSFQLIGGPA